MAPSPLWTWLLPAVGIPLLIWVLATILGGLPKRAKKWLIDDGRIYALFRQCIPTWWAVMPILAFCLSALWESAAIGRNPLNQLWDDYVEAYLPYLYDREVLPWGQMYSDVAKFQSSAQRDFYQYAPGLWFGLQFYLLTSILCFCGIVLHHFGALNDAGRTARGWGPFRWLASLLIFNLWLILVMLAAVVSGALLWVQHELPTWLGYTQSAALLQFIEPIHLAITMVALVTYLVTNVYNVILGWKSSSTT